MNKTFGKEGTIITVGTFHKRGENTINNIIFICKEAGTNPFYI